MGGPFYLRSSAAHKLFLARIIPLTSRAPRSCAREYAGEEEEREEAAENEQKKEGAPFEAPWARTRGLCRVWRLNNWVPQC